MLLGSAYAGGIWFFVQVAVQRRWHRVRHGFPAVLVFATLLSIATFLHWDRFHFGHISFITWVVLYVTTPVLVLVAILLNLREDDGAPEQRRRRDPARRGGTCSRSSASRHPSPGSCSSSCRRCSIDAWAWEVTPLTARIVGAVLTLPGMVNIWMLWDDRWSAFRRRVPGAAREPRVHPDLARGATRRPRVGSARARGSSSVGIVVSAVVYVGFYVSLRTASPPAVTDGVGRRRRRRRRRRALSRRRRRSAGASTTPPAASPSSCRHRCARRRGRPAGRRDRGRRDRSPGRWTERPARSRRRR